MPDRTAEQICKPISNAVPGESERASGNARSTTQFSPFSRNICFVCFRCLRASPGSSSWTSGMGPDHLDRVGPCDCSDRTTVPDVSASIRFCSAICSWSHGTSSGLETEFKSKLQTALTTIQQLHELPTIIFCTLKNAFDPERGLIAPRSTGAWAYGESTNVIMTCLEEANKYAQYTLSVTQLEVVFVFTVRKA